MAFEEVARKAITALKRAQVPYMVVGGIAVNYYGFPRATIDIDIALALEDEAAIERLTAALRDCDLEINISEVETAVNVGDRFVASSGGQRVDFWLVKIEHDRKALERRRTAKLFDTRAWICSPEDLIIFKLHAGRARDHEDVIGILHRQKGRLQMKYLNQQAEVLNFGEKLRELLREIKE